MRGASRVADLFSTIFEPPKSKPDIFSLSIIPSAERVHIFCPHCAIQNTGRPSAHQVHSFLPEIRFGSVHSRALLSCAAAAPQPQRTARARHRTSRSLAAIHSPHSVQFDSRHKPVVCVCESARAFVYCAQFRVVAFFVLLDSHTGLPILTYIYHASVTRSICHAVSAPDCACKPHTESDNSTGRFRGASKIRTRAPRAR